MSTAAPGNFNLAMTITSDVKAAVSDLRQFNAAVEQTAVSARSASDAQQHNAEVMAQLAAQIDPTIAKLERLDKLQAQLNNAKSVGAVGADDFAHFASIIDASRAALDNAGNSMHTFSLNSSMARMEIGRLIKDVATGQWERLGQSSLTLANYSGLMGAAFTATGAAVAGVTVVLGAFAAAAAKGADEDAAINRALVATGDYAGVSLGQVHVMAAEMSGGAEPVGKLRQALETLVASGKVTGDRLQEAAQGAVDFADLTNQSVEKAAQVFIKLQTDPVAAIKQLDAQYHVLTLTQYENIKALQEQGDADAAAAIAQTAAAQAFAQRAAEMRQDMGGLEKGWDALKLAAENAWDAMKGIGRQDTLNDDLAKVRDNIARTKQQLEELGGLSSAQAEASPDVQKLRAQEKALQPGANLENWAKAAQANDAKINEEAKRASDTMDRYLRSAKSDDDKAKEIADIRAATAARIKANPGNQSAYEADEKTAIAGVEKRFNRNTGAPIDRAELSAATQEARQELQRYTDAFTNAERTIDAAHKAGTLSDQAYWAGKRQDIDDYEAHQIAALEKEKGSVSQHGTSPADRIRIAQQVEGINEQIDKARADAAAKRMVLDDQEKQEADRKLQDFQKIQEAYLAATGRASDASADRIRQQYAKPLANAKLNGDNTQVQMIKVIIDAETAKAQLNELKQQIDEVFGNQSRQEQDVQTRLQAGLTTQIDAQHQIVQLHQQTYTELGGLVTKADALATSLRDPRSLQTIAQLNTQFQELGYQTDRITQEVQNTFQGAFDNVFNSLGTRITTVRQLFTTLLTDIASGIQRIVAQNLSQSLTSSLGGITGTISQWLGGSGQTVAQSAAALQPATALATAGTTSATAITTAGTTMSAAIIQAATIGAAALSSATAGGSGNAGSLLSLFGGSGVSASSTDASSLPSWLGSSFSSLASLWGFDGGGYTGDMPWHHVAGVVHGGEHVTRASVVSQPGARPFLDDFNRHGMASLHRHVPGYFEGGFVSAPSLAPMPSVPLSNVGRGASARSPINLHVTNVPHHSLVRDYLDSSEGSEHILNIIDNNPTRVRRSISGG